MNKLDQIISDIANESIPEDRIEQAPPACAASFFRRIGAGSERIRSCADYQALIASYLNRRSRPGVAVAPGPAEGMGRLPVTALRSARPAGNVFRYCRDVPRLPPRPLRKLSSTGRSRQCWFLTLGVGALVMTRNSLRKQPEPRCGAKR